MDGIQHFVALIQVYMLHVSPSVGQMVTTVTHVTSR